MEKCSVEGCENGGRRVKGMCVKHYTASWDSANRDKRRGYARDSYYKDLDKSRAATAERRRRVYAKDPERVKAQVKAWQAANPAKRESARHHYRARLQAADGFFSPEEWLALCERYDFKCLACGASKSLTPDHVVPLSQGGTNYIHNIQPLCRSCNCKKHTKTVDYR